VSRKTVSFSVPAKGAGSRRSPDVVIEAHSDDWVSDRHNRGGEARARPAAPSLILDLAAEPKEAAPAWQQEVFLD